MYSTGINAGTARPMKAISMCGVSIPYDAEFVPSIKSDAAAQAP